LHISVIDMSCNLLGVCSALGDSLAREVLCDISGGGGPPSKFSERLLNEQKSGLAGTWKPVKGYEPQS